MRGEGLLYGLAFLGILVAGALLIGPRLRRSPQPPADPARPAAGPASASHQPARSTAPAAPSVPLVDAPAPRRREVHVLLEGPAGGLRGPVKPVIGAESHTLGREDIPWRVDLVFSGPDREVAFGASGHRWVRRRAASLVAGERIVLPEAAPGLTVRVREADGSPAAGVPVEVRPASPAGARRTDMGGTVVLDDLGPGLVVVLVGGMERAAAPLRLVAGEDREARAVLEPAWSVSGRAVAADGGPLAGVRVEGFEARGATGTAITTDAQGRFTWRGPVASVLSLRFTTPDLASESVEAAPPATGALQTDVGDVRLALPAVEVSGRVRGGGGRAEARVVAEPQVAAFLREVFGPESVLDLPRTAPLEPDGSYRLTGLPSGVPLRLSLRGAGVPEDAHVKPAAGGTTTQDFAPMAGELLVARVNDGVTSLPAAGTVLLVSRDPVDGDLELPGDRRGVVDENGVAAVEGLLPGVWFVRAYRPGRRSLLQRIELPSAREIALSFEAVLADAPRRLTGVVLDEAKRPLAGLSVRAAGVTAVSAADGTFTLDGVESLAPTVTLEIGAEPGAPAGGADLRAFSRFVRQEVAPGGAPVTVHLPRDQALSVRAVDALTDQPLSFVHAVATADDGRVLVDRGYALVDGRLVLTGLPRAGVTLSLFTPGRRFVRTLPGAEMAAGTGAAEAVRDLGEARLLRALAIDGTATDERGAVVPDARVAAMDEGWLGGVRRDPAPRRELALRTVRTGADGTFRLEGLDPGKPAAVVVWAPGFAPTLRRAVLARPEQERKLVGTRSFLARAVDGEGGLQWVDAAWTGTPAPTRIEAGSPAWLELRAKGSDVARVLALGDRVVFALGEAAYEIVPAGAPATTPPPEPVANQAQRALSRLEAKIDVRLRRGSQVSLLLTDERTRQPVHGAIVDLESAGDGSDFLDLLHRGVIGGQAGTTDEWRAISASLLWEDREPGAYEIGPIEPGRYELLVEHPLYHPERMKIPVLDSSDPMSYEKLETEAGSDPRNPKVKRGEEMVQIYGGNRMRLPVDLRPR